VNRHDALRAAFGEDGGVPYQTLADEVSDLVVSDVSGLADDERSRAVEQILSAESTTPFDLRSGPLYRFQLARTGPDEYLLCLSFHHIIIDGWSTGILFSELPTIYQALRAGAEPALDPLPAQYADVLYTSGSSGKPKGVPVEHRALLSAVRAYGGTFGPAGRRPDAPALRAVV
jgi:acyl-CoA synthetase (AMP-forming)/AMP-acid ligase II